ncbi:MAG TPA: type II secretion system protein [Alphaproteobacteria bacterium]
MQQWLATYAVDTRSGPKKVTKTYCLPTIGDVRQAVIQEGGYVLSIRQHDRSVFERLLARSSWWQVQLLRGIQFRSSMTSPSVALWRLIEAENNPRSQNILAPAREALARGLGVIDALKALQMFDHSTLAILGASERSNKLQEGIPQAIRNITQKRKNIAKIAGTLGWIGFDLLSIVQGLQMGRTMILKWFRGNAPKDAEAAAKFNHTVDNLETLWTVLLWFAYAATAFLVWSILSFWLNRGKRDFLAAKLVRKVPMVGSYLRDLAFADSMMAASRMIKGNVSITDALQQSAEASNVPEVCNFWVAAYNDLSRGISLGAAMDRPPLSRSERMEIMTVSDLSQIATVLESIADIRAQSAQTKNSLIVWGAFIFTGLYLLIAFGSAIYALQLMNFSMDSMMDQMMQPGG